MIRKLPPWVEIGGFWLAGIAGFVNAVGVLGFEHQAVSHLTGTSTLLGVSLARDGASTSYHLLLILLSFVFGAMLSGFIVKSTSLKLGRRYSVALLVEGGLLYLAMLTLNAGSTLGHFLASAACGLQNAMASTYSGAVVRTTHVSGMFTDLGVMFGAFLRGEGIDTRKVFLYLLLIVGFITGGAVGTWAFSAYQFTSLAIPANLAVLAGIAYWLYFLREQRRLVQPARGPDGMKRNPGME